jgi:hypothetical protein
MSMIADHIFVELAKAGKMIEGVSVARGICPCGTQKK